MLRILRSHFAPALASFMLFALFYGGLALLVPDLRGWFVLAAALAAAVLAPLLLRYLPLPPPSRDPGETADSFPAPDAFAPAPAPAVEVEQRLADLKMLRQFSEALNFTVDFEAMLWLVQTHVQDLLHCGHFQIILTDPATGRLYTPLYVENEERRPEREGRQRPLEDARLLEIIEIGQIHEYFDGDGRAWLIAPLNAGADTVGALRAGQAEIGRSFPPQVYDMFARLAYNAAAAFDHWMTNQALHQRAQQLESLIGVIHSINAVQEVEPLLELIIEKAIELIQVEGGSCQLLDPENGELVFRVVRGPNSERLQGARLPYGKGIAGQVARTAEPLIVNDISESEQWFSGMDRQSTFHTRSVLTVPLVYQQEVLGVIQVVNRLNGVPFNQADLTLLTAFAGEAAMALQNARLLQQTDAELQDRVRELSLLRDIDRHLNQQLETEHTLQSTLEWMQRLFKATAGYVVLLDDEQRPLARDMFGYDSLFVEGEGWDEKNHPGLVGRALAAGEPLLAGDVAAEPNYVAAAAATRSQMTIPIIHEQRIIGAVAIESDRPQAYGAADLETAVSVVNHMTAAIVNSLLYRQVKAANLAKSEFISMVSHELKTPLTSIRGYTGLMKTGLAGELSERQREFVQTIDSNVTRMGTLIQDLTDVSRIDTGHLHMKIEPTPIAGVVNETLSSIRSIVEQKQIAVHVDLLPFNALVLGDHARLVQVLTNLLSNACKYSPRESDVFISVSNGEGRVRCEVRDTGYGISEEDQQRLFTKFFRAGDPNIRQEAGTGLGLSITKALVELHKGEIGFTSRLGEGTTFWFTIPLAEGANS